MSCVCFSIGAVTKTGGVIPERQSVFLGETAQFDCAFHGKVEWKFRGSDLPINANTAVDVGVNVLRIYSAIRNNAGVYTCISENVTAIVSASGRLDVLGETTTVLLW